MVPPTTYEALGKARFITRRDKKSLKNQLHLIEVYHLLLRNSYAQHLQYLYFHTTITIIRYNYMYINLNIMIRCHNNHVLNACTRLLHGAKNF